MVQNAGADNGGRWQEEGGGGMGPWTARQEKMWGDRSPGRRAVEVTRGKGGSEAEAAEKFRGKGKGKAGEAGAAEGFRGRGNGKAGEARAAEGFGGRGKGKAGEAGAAEGFRGRGMGTGGGQQKDQEVEKGQQAIEGPREGGIGKVIEVQQQEGG